MGEWTGGGRRLVLLALMCLLLVGGCGFKLRGARIDAGRIPDIFIHSERGSQLFAEVHRVFHQAGIKIVDSQEQAVWVLTLSDELRERRVLSVSSSGKVQEYELHYGVYYTLAESDGRNIVERQPLTLLRDFSFSGADVLAKADEEERLYQGMQGQAAQMILQQLMLQRDKAGSVNTLGGAGLP
jgi:LPS-assembly lipoprotein